MRTALLLLLCSVAALAQKPCQDPKYRELDFWIGDWNATQKDQKVGTSVVVPISSGCGISENWSSMQTAYTGKSITYYDPETKRWRQTWVGAGGDVSQFTGELKGNTMRFEGYTHSPGGRKVLRRMTLTPVSEGVRHFSEQSADGGKTWNETYDMLYTK